jgi:hypothetical protein
MEIKLSIPNYSEEAGFRFEWEYGFEIKVIAEPKAMVIIANKAGLISLARQLLTLAQDEVPSGYHVHYDEGNSLEDGSAEMVVQKL